MGMIAPCSTCQGSGMLETTRCNVCEGQGEVYYIDDKEAQEWKEKLNAAGFTPEVGTLTDAQAERFKQHVLGDSKGAKADADTD